MVIGGREPAQDDRDVGMKPFDDLRKGQGALDMGHPVKIDPKGHGLMFFDEFFDIESFILEHLHGDIDDPDLEAVALQIFRETGKPNGIHFKDGRGGDDVADRTMDPREFSEVVKGWRMKKDEVSRHGL